MEEERQDFKHTTQSSEIIGSKSGPQRLIIKKIKLTNFKSYYGTHEIGPFHPNFSSVIGPNGSGKSNLIDSLVFIFGKRASWMRLKNLRELIHNSAKYGACEKAEVSVEFVEIRENLAPLNITEEKSKNTKSRMTSKRRIEENEQEYKKDEKLTPTYFEVEGSSFIVSRSIRKNDESTYKLNNQKVSQGDVINLLKSKGIDLDNNRFMILQGEVEQISLMKPKTGNPDNPGFLEYLEEIIGTNVLIDPIKELESQLEILKTEKLEKTEDFRVIEEEMAVLNASKNEAMDFLKQEKEIFQLKNLQLQVLIKRENEKLKKAGGQLIQLEADEKKETNKFQEKMSEYKYVFDKINALKKVKDELNITKDKLLNKYKDIEVKYEEKKKEIENLIAEETKKLKKIERIEARITKIIEDKAELNSELPKADGQIKTLEKQKEETEKRVEGITTKLKSKLESYTIRLNELNAEFLDLDREKNELIRKNSAFESTIETLENKCKELKMKKENGEKENKAKTEKVNLQNGFIDRLEQTRNSIYEQTSKLDIEVQSLHKSLNERLDEQRHIKNELEEIRMIQSHAEGKNRVLRELLSAQSAGKLSGIRGRLGDLLLCPKELDVAVSTAAFMSWDKIVVNTYDDAQKALEYLRREKIGKAGFLALDKLGYLRPKIQEKTYQGNEAKRLFDLIKPAKEDLIVAIFWALGQTLVCPNLDTAKKVAYGKIRHKVVTYDGSLIDISGIMTGGGDPKRGLVNSDNKNMDVSLQKNNEKVLQEKFEIVLNQINQLRNNYEEKKQFLELSKREFKQIENEITKKSFEKLEFQNELEISRANLIEVDKNLKALQKELKKIEESNPEFKTHKNKIAAIEKRIMPINESIFEFEKKIEELGGEELKTLKLKLKEIEASITEYVEKLNNKDARMKNFDKQIDRCRIELEEINAELEENNKQKEHNKIEQDKLAEKAMQIMQEQNENTEKIDNNSADLEKIKSEFKEFEKILQQLKDNLKKIKNEKDEIEGKKHEFKISLNKFKDQLVRLRAEYKDIISNYEFLDELHKIDLMGQELDDNRNHNHQPMEERPAQNMLQEENGQSGVKNQNLVRRESNEAKRRSSVSNQKRILAEIDWQMVLNVEVSDDYPENILEELQGCTNEIEAKIKVETNVKLEMKPNLDSISAFKAKFEVFKIKKTYLYDLRSRTEKTRTELEKLKDERKVTFLKGFSIISAKLKETYQTLTNGGDAELELIDCLDPFNEGILFSVRPPQKSWKQMSKLSGGEKTLSSLSFVYALHYYKPNPVYFMDEIDAALDYKNVSIVAKFIKEKTKNAQFIVISLRNNMYEMANKLFGIYKTMDTTKTIAIEPEVILAQIPTLDHQATAHENGFIE